MKPLCKGKKKGLTRRERIRESLNGRENRHGHSFYAGEEFLKKKGEIFRGERKRQRKAVLATSIQRREKGSSENQEPIRRWGILGKGGARGKKIPV